MSIPNQSLIPFFTFPGNAEEAMEFYASSVPDMKIESLVRFDAADQGGDEGKIKNGVLAFRSQLFMFMDMQSGYPVPDQSWATSFMVPARDEADFDSIFAALAEGGSVMMGPESVPGFKKVAWVTDKYGITWQPVWE